MAHIIKEVRNHDIFSLVYIFVMAFIPIKNGFWVFISGLRQARPYWIKESGMKMLEWTCYTEYGMPSGHSMLGLVLM